MPSLHPALHAVTERIRARSHATRTAYVARMKAQEAHGPRRLALSCGNQAHAFAGCGATEKADLKGDSKANLGIVSAYNDMLSAHEPYQHFPAIIKHEAQRHGGIAQFAGGVPAMCDGVTQGQPGMELSLFSRDVIAQSTAIALSHNTFDGALMLGICDKIVPGLLMGALAFGHLPVVFVPGGPMPSGLPNKEKQRIRQLYAEGKATRAELLEAEIQSYHSPGTCTFYGTANTNQMLMEIMGLQLPGSSFVNPYTPLRDALTRAAVRQALATTALAAAAGTGTFTPLYRVVDVGAVVNGLVGLLATGGSTNHTIHLIAMARAAGILIDWNDFAELSAVVPLLCRVYPNGEADVNHFHAAGGMTFLISTLLDAGLLHADVTTILGPESLAAYRQEPRLEEHSPTGVTWQPGAATSGDTSILRPVQEPFSAQGGLTLMQGNLGRGIMKTSAVKPQHRTVEAPARVFTSQHAMAQAFERGELHCDCVAVVVYQGPGALGMPELHKLTPPLGVLQDLGYKVALVTDGRMSGASGKVPAAIHVSPEALRGGPLAKVRDGDIIRVDGETGTLEALVDPAEWAARTPLPVDLTHSHHGTGRELFATFRQAVTSAEEGASVVV